MSAVDSQTNTAWVGVIGALGGVLIGATAEAIRSRISFSREKRWARLETQRRHLEAIYESLEAARESYNVTVNNAALTIAKGSPLQNQLEGEKVPRARLRLLVHLYAPSLAPSLSEVERAGEQLAFAAVDVTLGPQSKNPQSERAKRLHEATLRFANAVDKMRDAIIVLSQRSDAEMQSLAPRDSLLASWRNRFRGFVLRTPNS